MNNKLWNKKRVLVTGHTGFKGSWLSIWLLELGAEVIGYSLTPHTSFDNFVVSNLSEKMVDINGDIRDFDKLKTVFDKYKPEVIFHLAAQPLVRESYKNPLETYQINLMGTMNVLECIRKSEFAQIGIIVTTDKCYENKEQIWGYRENDALGGFDPYSSSKGCCEILISSWRNSFMNPLSYSLHSKAIASVRAGNVIGGGDWSKDRIVPDCIRAIEKDSNIELRNPNSIRPWQHVLEPLYGYITLAEKMAKFPTEFCEAWNFGPNLNSIVTVKDVATKIVKLYGKGSIRHISTGATEHEANLLLLDTTKTVFRLEWNPKLSIDKAIDLTVDWYKNYKCKDVYKLCTSQINDYIRL